MFLVQAAASDADNSSVPSSWLLAKAEWGGASGLTGETTLSLRLRPKRCWTITEGIGAPAGVVYDSQRRELYVSQIGGEGDKKDGDGLVSRIDLQGRVVNMAWVAGLNAPKGLALCGDTLWVTDIDELVAIDRRSGKIRRKIAIDGAKFLTGVAIDAKGLLYVGDMLTSRIYRVERDSARVFVDGPAIESPAALLISDDRLLVAGWGYTTDYSTTVPGSLFYLDPKTRKQTSLALAPRGNWFGLSRRGDKRFLAADFASGRIYEIDENGRSTCLLSLPRGCAGIAYVPDAELLVVAETRENRVAGFTLGAVAKQK